MASSRVKKLKRDLYDAGTKLLALASSATTPVPELLNVLDQVDGLLSKVEQRPFGSMEPALYVSMKALISDQLMKHSDIDVKVSVASCMSEITRISAPNAPYHDAQMKEIFQLKLMALGKLSSEDPRGYSKALHILDNMTRVRACLLMLDLECDDLIADMFKLFLSTIRNDNHSSVVFEQMESIMTRTIKESDEIPEELLDILLTSVNMREERFWSRTWMLAEIVLRNCTSELQHLIPKFVRSRELNYDDYCTTVATMCLNFTEDENVVRVSPSTFTFLYGIKLCFFTQNSSSKNVDTYNFRGLRIFVLVIFFFAETM
ncbi:sister chromatid cohesion protein PDS5-like [Heracleum sosnowskyi]|uniref:Sister chromatid cohesion protein PDS5-like n=1 Tax=Heracleum sosnowskyi TaxID=360622 RepID=A0AAD8ITB2_9APIA|nr:sister chromatid cohesion protein PDS5-like [Heracleum sosnowskyi]